METTKKDIISVHMVAIASIGYLGFKVANLSPDNPLFVTLVGIGSIAVMVFISKLVATLSPAPSN